MTNRITDTSQRNTARIAGFLYLLIVLCALFSMMYVPSKLIVWRDAATTAKNIMASELLFRFGIVGDSVVFVSEIALTVLLYILLKPVNKTLALVSAFSRLAMAVIQGINLLNLFFVLFLLSGAAYLTVFNADQLHALVMLFLNAHENGVYVWGVFFGFHLMVLGYLVFKSGFFPRMPGVLMMIGSLGYLMESYSNFLSVNNEAISTITSFFLATSVIGEFSFMFWLLLKGVKVQQTATRKAN